MKKNDVSEEMIDDWIKTTDLTKADYAFKSVNFKGIKKTDWEAYYDENQKATVPVSLRLPKFIITKIKQKAIESGIPYQTLIRLWIAERLGLR